MKTLCDAVRLCLENEGLYHAQSRLLCGISGGADSVALLVALSLLQKEVGFSLTALHVQHGLRGQASDADEAHVRMLCQTLNVPCRVEKLRLSGTMEDAGMETLAREKRMECFANQLQNADALLLAHHADDQAETVLMHLLRGSGLTGLCGMKCSSAFAGKRLLRPFLNLPKQMLSDALQRNEIPYREDESNAHLITPRNVLRLKHLPELEALYPAAGKHIAQTAMSLQADEDCLSALAETLYQSCLYDTKPLRLLRLKQELLEAHPALLRRVVRRFWSDAVPVDIPERALSHADTLRLCELLFSPMGESINLPCQLIAVHGANCVHLHRQGEPPVPMSETEQIVSGLQSAYYFSHAAFEVSPVSQGAGYSRNASYVLLTPEVQRMQPVLRLPRAGDRIHPMGASGAKPLRRFFTDRKCDPLLRAHLPVLAVGSDILWVPSVCVSEALRIGPVPAETLRLAHTPFLSLTAAKE